VGGNQKNFGSTVPEYSPVAMGLVLRTKMPFNKCEVYCIVNSIRMFGLIDVTLHFHSPMGSPLQSFIYNFRLDYEQAGSSTLSKVHHSSIFIINMDVANGYISYAHAPLNKNDTL